MVLLAGNAGLFTTLEQTQMSLSINSVIIIFEWIFTALPYQSFSLQFWMSALRDSSIIEKPHKMLVFVEHMFHFIYDRKFSVQVFLNFLSWGQAWLVLLKFTRFCEFPLGCGINVKLYHRFLWKEMNGREENSFEPLFPCFISEGTCVWCALNLRTDCCIDLWLSDVLTHQLHL